jgi:VIT1/CCC1 family predicted Fe2+/Mn2+ transporter
MKRIIKNKGARTGIFFGATSGAITTIGLMVGLHAGTESLVAVLGGILVVAVADAMSDAMGIHLAQEADPDSTSDHIWAATFWTFGTKLVVALTFSLPLLWLPLQTAVIVSVSWGLLVIVLLSVLIARIQRVNALPVITEHLAIAMLVVTVSYFIGTWVRSAFA